MHLRANANITKFLREVRKCNAEVCFETSERDHLNLKSTLSQFIFCSLCTEPEILYSGKVLLEDISDRERLGSFLEDDNDDR